MVCLTLNSPEVFNGLVMENIKDKHAYQTEVEVLDASQRLNMSTSEDVRREMARVSIEIAS